MKIFNRRSLVINNNRALIKNSLKEININKQKVSNKKNQIKMLIEILVSIRI